MSDVTRILSQIKEGDPAAAERLLPLVYDELRRLAAAKMAQERSDHTLQATALVHEAYIRLVDTDRAQNWDSRGHFFAAAAEAMRRILVENARRKLGKQRGGDRKRVGFTDDAAMNVQDPALVLDIHDALNRLSEQDPPMAELVKLHCFGGLSITDAAEVLGISKSTAYANWIYAKALMGRLLADD